MSLMSLILKKEIVQEPLVIMTEIGKQCKKKLVCFSSLFTIV